MGTCDTWLFPLSLFNMESITITMDYNPVTILCNPELFSSSDFHSVLLQPGLHHLLFKHHFYVF